MYSRELIIKTPLGLHTRYSAMIVNKASEIESKYKVKLYIKKESYTDWLGISMLAILSLKVLPNESILIGSKNEGMIEKLAVQSLLEFIDKNINNPIESEDSEIDEIIDASIVANEQVLESLPIGIVVIDIDQNIITINQYALRFIGCNKKDVKGKKINEVIPSSQLPRVMLSNLKKYGSTLHINNRVGLVNSSPLFINDKIIGAVSVIQDVSDIIGMKEINEKFTKILENSQDMICFVDENGIINYLNPAYIKNFSKVSSDVIGKSIFDIAPNGLRAKVFKEKTLLKDVIHKKNGINVISTIDPLFIDGQFKGVISTSRPVSLIKELMSKLNKSEQELDYYKNEFLRQLSKNSSFNNIIGSTRTLKDIMYMCQKASETTSTVLIRGESGTGKELIAKAIHNNSNRKNKPFVRVNCASIPENLLESELFGYEKGAFTGAVQSKPGKFAIADTGTIFLDEIGDMPLSMQVKLLRVLQEREIESVGGITPKNIDVRVIAATNRNLEEMIEEGSFREDLYYRLNVLGINLPPLRERKEDIPELAEHFITKLNKKLHKTILGIKQDALNLLIEYSWPGNIRELENIMERAINLCDGDYIDSSYLPSYLKPVESKSFNLNIDIDHILPFEEYEKQIIEAAMKKYKSFNKAGKALGLTHRTVSLKCKKYNIDVKK
ncbi:sigma 54-interacting transcriptional regulator [Clostridium perfringens]|uniref:sigma 54-interacting transcriptional regulator n=1 Tax=Clostridium perfringens TaxID=1502 RepID=UPI003F42F05C